VLNMPECQVNPRLGDIRFFGNLMLEVLLGVPRHDQQASVRQPLCKMIAPFFPLSTNRRSAPRRLVMLLAPSHVIAVEEFFNTPGSP